MDELKKIRKKKLLCNTIAAGLNQLVTMCCSFVLPRLILLNYGSHVNGLIISITQFMGFVSLMEMGVGAVVQSALYKPLIDGDRILISRIVCAANKFFKNIAKVLCIYTIVLIFFYKYFIHTELNSIFIAGMILVLSINVFAQYFFGITNQLLLNADQKSYIQLLLNSTAVVLSTIVGVILIKLNVSIILMKMITSFVLLIRPLGMAVYVRKNYQIDKNVKSTSETLKQKWNGLFQHLASFVLQHTDIAVLTMFSTLENVSIYGVYHLITNGLNQVITILTTGVQAFFGELYARNEKYLKVEFEKFEWIMHNSIVFLFSSAGVLICPFVGVYTNGVENGNYIQPIFGILLVSAQAVCCLRMPYNIMVKAAGCYKETQMGAFVEAIINVTISMILVKKLGLVGVAIGTLIAMLYRTIYLARYLSKEILKISFKGFVKRVLVDILLIILIYSSGRYILQEVSNYWEFVLVAIKVFFSSSLIVIAINISICGRETAMHLRSMCIFSKK